MKRVSTILLLLALVTVTALAGCSSDGGNGGGSKEAGNTAEPGKSADKNIVIEYWSTPTFKNVEGDSDPNFGDWEQKKIDEFVKANPNVKINFQMVPFDAIEQKMTIALTGNNPPDILLDGLDRRLMKYVKFDKNEPLDDFIEADKSDYNQEVLNTLTKDERLYGIPVMISSRLMFINKKLFEDKGLGQLIPANREWTFEQWRDAMKQVSGGGIHGTALFAASEQADEMNLMYLFGAGAELWNEDSTEVVLNKYPQAAEVLQTLKDMVDEGSIAPGAATMNGVDVLEMFKQGKIAMLPWAMTMYGLIDNGKLDGSVNPDVDLYGILPVHKEGVTPKVPGGITGYTVFKQSDPDKREMIKKFLNFMLTADNVQKLSKANTGLPARTSSFYEYPSADMTAVMSEVAKLPQANLGAASPVYAEVRQTWYPALQAVLLGHMTPQQAIDDYVQKANKVIADQQ
ncbi:ABC transporter substrate-binding protein [Paenibacillus sp. GCM10027626]|uniref:ABC transporter substrate-binding protein n=1 Tax=Paenibacillus sp. GCM10027626 TaxID=3273411 RepID=UPI0036360A0A